MKKVGLIKLVYRSPQAFYTLTGVEFEKGMTPSYRGVILNHNQRILSNLLRINNFNKPSIHDIRLLFHVKDLRNILLSNNNRSIIDKVDEKHNKHIVLKDIHHDNIKIKTTVHNTDNISVIIACHDNPIEIDNPFSLSILVGGLARIEERLQQEINTYLKNYSAPIVEKDQEISVPFRMNWIVKMWHFNQDSSQKYTGKLFDMTVKESLEIFHIYSKKSKTIKTLQ